MSGVYPWQRAFWSDARDGFRFGWVFGVLCGLFVVGVVAVASFAVNENVGALLCAASLLVLGWLGHDWHAHRDRRGWREKLLDEPSESRSQP